MKDSKDPKPKRRWYQFSLRSLFVVMTLFAIPCSFIAYERQKTAKIRAAVAKINSMGGRAQWGELDTAQWLACSKITDAGMVHVKGLTNLYYLVLDNTQISDAGLVHLEGLTKLQRLDLEGTQVTDEGVKKLEEALPNCTIHHSPMKSI